MNAALFMEHPSRFDRDYPPTIFHGSAKPGYIHDERWESWLMVHLADLDHHQQSCLGRHFPVDSGDSLSVVRCYL